METQAKSIVLILGARGRLGTALAEAFGSAGWQVLSQARATPGRDLTNVIAADVRDVVLRGLNKSVADSNASGLRWGLDSRVHAVNGGSVSSPRTPDRFLPLGRR